MIPTAYISFGISICFISWIAAMLLNWLLMKSKWYAALGDLNFIRDEKLNRLIGVDLVKWIIKHTFFKFFNPGLKINGKASIDELKALREQMTYSEISHLIGFVLVAFIALIMSFQKGFLFFFIVMLINSLMNLHPSLLQQQNKRRIDRLIERYG